VDAGLILVFQNELGKFSYWSGCAEAIGYAIPYVSHALAAKPAEVFDIFFVYPKLTGIK